MAAYMRELCLDYAIGHVDHLEKIDIDSGITALWGRGELSPAHIITARAYLQGYSVAELEIDYPNVRTLLIQFFALLAAETQYSDEYVVRLALRRNPKLAPTIDAHRVKLEEYGRSF